MKKKLIPLVLLLSAVLALSGCSGDRDDSFGINEYATTGVGESGTTRPHDEPGTTALPTTAAFDLPTAGTTAADPSTVSSWQSNYTLTYTFTENGERSELTETRCDGLYSARDAASGAVSYFRQNGSDIDSYVLNPTAKTGTHRLLTGKSLADITTGFMKIAYIDPSFTTLSNVEYQGSESVAGRPAAKYIQSVYDGTGLLTAYAFVWIDSEYGFVSKCMVYNLTGAVNTSWELLSLSVGGIDPVSAAVSTDGYTLTEDDSES